MRFLNGVDERVNRQPALIQPLAEPGFFPKSEFKFLYLGDNWLTILLSESVPVILTAVPHSGKLG